jgi:hypothetical protein
MICNPGSVGQGRELSVEWRNLHNKELNDLHSRQCCVREGSTGEWRNLHNKELHDLHSRYCGVGEGANTGMEKSA